MADAGRIADRPSKSGGKALVSRAGAMGLRTWNRHTISAKTHSGSHMRSLKSFITHYASSFWPLQVVGWFGYFVLNLSALMAEGKPYHYIYYSLGGALSGFLV